MVASAQAPTDPAAWLYDPGHVVEIDMTLPQQSIDALNDVPDEYQDGDVHGHCREREIRTLQRRHTPEGERLV